MIEKIPEAGEYSSSSSVYRGGARRAEEFNWKYKNKYKTKPTAKFQHFRDLQLASGECNLQLATFANGKNN